MNPSPSDDPTGPASGTTGSASATFDRGRRLAAARTWVYQLQGYSDRGLGEIASSPQDIAVVDLARDAQSDWFRRDELDALHAHGKLALAYFEIGSIENFRPEYPLIRGRAGDLVLNRWDAWPQEHFVQYWDDRWWNLAVRPRVDQALAAGFDGVYLDTLLAYEEIDLTLVPERDRDELARAMADLVIRLSRYAKARDPRFLIFPQNSPELRDQPGFTDAIDGIGMEELFFQAMDDPCNRDWCAENLAEARALRDAGKVVLAVDYARQPANVAQAERRYRSERFVGYVADVDLDSVRPPPGRTW